MKKRARRQQTKALAKKKIKGSTILITGRGKIGGQMVGVVWGTETDLVLTMD